MLRKYVWFCKALERVAVVCLCLLSIMLIGLLTRGDGIECGVIAASLVGKPLPELAIPLLNEPDQTFVPSEMKGQVWLLHYWASWSNSQTKQRLLAEFAKQNRLTIIGLSYKERGHNTTEQNQISMQWLAQHGNPYQRILADHQGITASDFGVWGVPTAYLIDQSGIVRQQLHGRIDQSALEQLQNGLAALQK